MSFKNTILSSLITFGYMQWKKGLKIPIGERTKTTNALLVSLMNQLEKDKKSVKLGHENNLHLEGFALNVFAKADKQDRAGRADFLSRNRSMQPGKLLILGKL
ncbi:hypothetical protein GQ457_01G006640 [Hibiscus cannabinus]